ncbi:MAG: WD40 repeat domain-containing protein [Flammeovirgaceae bacterium]
MTARIKVEVSKIGTFTGHRDSLYTIEPSGEQNHFFASGGDRMVVEWNLLKPNHGKLIARTENTIYALCFLSEKNQLLVGENTAGIHLIDVNSQAKVNSTKITEDAVFDIKHKAGKVFVALGDGEVVVLEVENLTTLKRLKHSSASARCIALHPNKPEFVVGYSDHSFRIFSTETFELLYETVGHSNSIFTVNYSPDGKFLLSGSRDAHLKIWNAATGYELYEDIVAHMFTINHITYSTDGRYFATGSKDKTIKIWDAKRFKLLKVIDKARHGGHNTSVNKLHWADQNLLISVSDDRSISVWNLAFDVPESLL